MQRMKLIFLFIILILLTSCSSQEQVNPQDILQTYVNFWEEQQFSEMYDMLTTETKESFSTKDFVDRYDKIYEDLQIKNVNVTIVTDESETEKTTSTYPLVVTMDSVAGPIKFNSDITLESFVDEENDIDTWLINWNPGLIFPDLLDGGKIKVEQTEPERGVILDRNEMPLAINDVAYEVGVVPEQFVNKENEIEQLASLLHLSKNSITNSIEADWVQPGHFVPLRTVPKSDESTLSQLQNIPSVVTRESTGRMYPSSDAISHLIGYIGKITDEELKELADKDYTDNDSIGKRGLERLYEDRLKGESGVKISIVSEDETGAPVQTTLAEKPVTHGEKIQLTIDVNLQEILYKQYEDELSGTAAAINPKTGEILALVSSPSFDPIPLTYGISQTAWDALMEDKGKPFVNRFSATFAPGSVIKPVIAAIGLGNKSITHEEGLNIQGLTWKKSNWKNFHITRVSTSNGPVTLEDALKRSDNIYFAMKSVDMGNDKMVKGLKDFGFNEDMPIEYPFKNSQISNDGDLKDEVLRANTGYGQGEVEVNVLHMALLYSPIINDGNMVKPVLQKSDQTGETWKENLINENDQTKLNDYLRKIVTEGTATIINDEDVDISGKTGTAELKLSRESKGQENGWFVGYPTKDEDIIIAMLIEQVEGRGASGFVAKKVANTFNEYKKLQE